MIDTTAVGQGVAEFRNDLAGQVFQPRVPDFDIGTYAFLELILRQMEVDDDVQL